MLTSDSKHLGSDPSEAGSDPNWLAGAKHCIWELLKTIPDPEIPVISIVDLGIVRRVDTQNETVTVTLTPTYSGCPATEVIADDVRQALSAAGYSAVSIQTQYAPAWTTDWMSAETKEKLRSYGIAPPHTTQDSQVVSLANLKRKPESIACPRCGSILTRLVSQFGATPCQAQYRCTACDEPFDYFKPH